MYFIFWFMNPSAPEIMPNLRSLHFDVQVISRGQGKSSVASASYRSGKKLQEGAPTRSALAAASYRSGEMLYDEGAQKFFDYTRKEDIRHSEIMAPTNAPKWALNREVLWNMVEKTEKRKDAQLARDVIAVFPRELTEQECQALLREYVNDNFVSKGMVADFSIHQADASDGGKNPHAHIMLTLREIGPDGFGKKNREWNNQKLVTSWRNSWERYSNQYLEMAGHEVRITLESYEKLGINKIPGVHMGAEQWQLEQRKRQETRRGNKNRAIKQENAVNQAVDDALDAEQYLNEADQAIQVLSQAPERETPIHSLAAESLAIEEDKPESDMAEENNQEAGWAASADVAENLGANSLEATARDAALNLHNAAIQEYAQVTDFSAARKQVITSARLRHYTERFLEKTKELAGRAYRQVVNLMRETTRERGKTYER